MLKTVKGIVRKKRIQLIENIDIPDVTKLLITIMPDDNDDMFWQNASLSSLDKIWNNKEDNIYAELPQK